MIEWIIPAYRLHELRMWAEAILLFGAIGHGLLVGVSIGDKRLAFLRESLHRGIRTGLKWVACFALAAFFYVSNLVSDFFSWLF